MERKFTEFNEFGKSDSLCYLCIPGTEIECWLLTQEIAGSNTATLFFNYIIFVTEFSEHFWKNLNDSMSSLGKTVKKPNESFEDWREFQETVRSETEITIWVFLNWIL